MFFRCASADVENKRGLKQPSVNSTACFYTKDRPEIDSQFYVVNRVINTYVLLALYHFLRYCDTTP